MSQYLIEVNQCDHKRFLLVLNYDLWNLCANCLGFTVRKAMYHWDGMSKVLPLLRLVVVVVWVHVWLKQLLVLL